MKQGNFNNFNNNFNKTSEFIKLFDKITFFNQIHFFLTKDIKQFLLVFAKSTLFKIKKVYNFLLSICKKCQTQ